MEGRSLADRRGDRYHIILCVVIGEMTLSTCLLCRLLTQDENQSFQNICRTNVSCHTFLFYDWENISHNGIKFKNMYKKGDDLEDHGYKGLFQNMIRDNSK